MGHGLRATLLTSVALAAYRTSRRAGAALRDIGVSMDQAIAEHFGADSFVTALLAQLDVRHGTLAILSAGHPPPLLLREGKIIGSVETEPGPPLGIGLRDDAIAELSLQPGDTLLLYTDGVVEARTPDGEFFGLQRLADFLARQAASQLPPPEVLRRLMDAILEHQKSDLQDDATCVLLEWAGASPGQFDLARQAHG
jgi:serine phosphatase RsbU (regulator of sigma subunit)